MPSPREMLEGESLEQLADRMQFGASTAAYTKQTGRYMPWSVVAIFVTSGLSALFSFLAWAYPRH
jgi:hypothetical protein